MSQTDIWRGGRIGTPHPTQGDFLFCCNGIPRGAIEIFDDLPIISEVAYAWDDESDRPDVYRRDPTRQAHFIHVSKWPVFFGRRLEQIEQSTLQDLANIRERLGENGEMNADDLDNALDSTTRDMLLNQRRLAQHKLEQVRACLHLIERHGVLDPLSDLDQNEHKYGQCQICLEPIGWDRLDAVPYTQYCIRHARENGV